MSDLTDIELADLHATLANGISDDDHQDKAILRALSELQRRRTPSLPEGGDVEMAREWLDELPSSVMIDQRSFDEAVKSLIALLSRVRADEAERCAKVAEGRKMPGTSDALKGYTLACDDIAFDIRRSPLER